MDGDSLMAASEDTLQSDREENDKYDKEGSNLKKVVLEWRGSKEFLWSFKWLLTNERCLIFQQ